MVLPGCKSWRKACNALRLSITSKAQSHVSAPAPPPPPSCSICLESMKLGHALFTAECSHSFHFSCIASNVRHGNLVCPVCRATWTEVPFHGREMCKALSCPLEGFIKSTISTASDSYHHPTKSSDSSPANKIHSSTYDSSAVSDVSGARGLNPSSFKALSLRDAEEEQRRLEPVLRMLDETIATIREEAAENRGEKPGHKSHRIKSSLELSTSFDDDEALGQSINAEVSTAARAHEQHHAMEITTVVAEEDLREGLHSDSFSVLIQLKALDSARMNQEDPSLNGREKSLNQKDPSQKKRAGVDLVAVLDVSGSMAGPKLGLLKQAMRLMVRSLGQADRLSVVAFSSRARRVMPLRRMTVEGRRAAMEAVESLVCDGGTSITDGLCKGLAVLHQRRERNPVGAIMLLSDGQDSFTMQSPTAPLVELARSSRSEGGGGGSARGYGGGNKSYEIFPVHTFGLGIDHDATTLHAIAEESRGGTFSFIQGEGHDVQDAFAQCLGGLLSVVAQRVEVEVQLMASSLPGGDRAELASVEAGSYVCTAVVPGKHLEVHFGDLYADEERDMLASVSIPIDSEEQHSNCPDPLHLLVRARYVDPLSGASLQMDATPVDIVAEKELMRSRASCCVHIDQHRNRLLGSKAIAAARSLADSGDFLGAQGCLHAARAQLKCSLPFQLGDSQTKALDTELGQIQSQMKSRHIYNQTCGRAYALSAQSSYLRQRAATRATSEATSARGCNGEGASYAAVADGVSMAAYCTPSMSSMLHLSRTFSSSTVSSS